MSSICCIFVTHTMYTLVHHNTMPYWPHYVCLHVLQGSTLSPYFCSSYLPHSSLKSQQHGDGLVPLLPPKLCPRSHSVRIKEYRTSATIYESSCRSAAADGCFGPFGPHHQCSVGQSPQQKIYLCTWTT